MEAISRRSSRKVVNAKKMVMLRKIIKVYNMIGVKVGREKGGHIYMYDVVFALLAP